MLLIFGQQWAYAWPVLGLLALSKGIMTPCSTFIPYLKGAGTRQRAVVGRRCCARSCLWLRQLRRDDRRLVDGDDLALHRQCRSRWCSIPGRSFATNGMAFFPWPLCHQPPMITAIIMAVSVRFLLENIKADLPGAISQVVVGGLAGGLPSTPS